MLEPCGFLNLDKPAGCTSRDVVNRVQRWLRNRQRTEAPADRPASRRPSLPKVGHAGTLDPLATGVLVVAIGRATRLIEAVQDLPKTYVGRFRCGLRSSTEDITGDLIETPPGWTISRDDLISALAAQVGTILQRPPAVSALHVDGRRAYDLVRAGQHVELPPRPVHIDRCELLEFEPPDFTIEVHCGSGTYVRSIGRDVGDRLGCGAVMTELSREAIGPFRRQAALPAEALESSSGEVRDLPLISPVAAVADWPRWDISTAEALRLAQGQLLQVADGMDWPAGSRVACVLPGEQLWTLGIVEVAMSTGVRLLRPQVVLGSHDDLR